ncbi:MAG: hypothetical protein QXH03_10255 [Candidatus Bathyarchaeia archaeon]
MTLWDDIVGAIDNFWRWLQDIGGNILDPLSQLGSWIYGGLVSFAKWIYDGIRWMADQVYMALEWLADRLKEGYDALAQWIGSGLQWISSGLSYIGQQLYNFGMWLWNGINWVFGSIWNLIVTAVNWLVNTLRSAWNTIVSFASNFVNSLNNHVNNWIKSFRDKFIQLFVVNTSLMLVRKGFDKFIDQPSLKSLITAIASPILPIITAPILDSLIPKPQSQKVLVYIPFELPFWETTSFNPTMWQIPNAPEYPEIIVPPTPRPENTVKITNAITTDIYLGISAGQFVDIENGILTEFEHLIEEASYLDVENNILSDFSHQIIETKLIDVENRILTEFEHLIGETSYLDVENNILSDFSHQIIETNLIDIENRILTELEVGLIERYNDTILETFDTMPSESKWYCMYSIRGNVYTYNGKLILEEYPYGSAMFAIARREYNRPPYHIQLKYDRTEYIMPYETSVLIGDPIDIDKPYIVVAVYESDDYLYISIYSNNEGYYRGPIPLQNQYYTFDVYIENNTIKFEINNDTIFEEQLSLASEYNGLGLFIYGHEIYRSAIDEFKLEYNTDKRIEPCEDIIQTITSSGLSSTTPISMKYIHEPFDTLPTTDTWYCGVETIGLYFIDNSKLYLIPGEIQGAINMYRRENVSPPIYTRLTFDVSEETFIPVTEIYFGKDESGVIKIFISPAFRDSGYDGSNQYAGKISVGVNVITPEGYIEDMGADADLNYGLNKVEIYISQEYGYIRVNDKVISTAGFHLVDENYDGIRVSMIAPYPYVSCIDDLYIEYIGKEIYRICERNEGQETNIVSKEFEINIIPPQIVNIENTISDELSRSVSDIIRITSTKYIQSEYSGSVQ